VAAALLVFLVVALLSGGPEPGKLVFHWPVDERRDVTLMIDGDPVEFPPKGSLKHECLPGMRTVTAIRPRYQPFTAKVDVVSGTEREVEVRWRPRASVVLDWAVDTQYGIGLEMDGQVTSLEFLDAFSYGDTVQFAVEPGEHRLRITREGVGRKEGSGENRRVAGWSTRERIG
jgi:hypothetical protein